MSLCNHFIRVINKILTVLLEYVTVYLNFEDMQVIPIAERTYFINPSPIPKMSALVLYSQFSLMRRTCLQYKVWFTRL